ncbi:MAG: OsmC family protein [Rhodobacterales bacterium]|nr:OsmC family protein [Rhodobacterales bacterium]
MTQIRAFAKRLNVPLNDLTVDVRVQWDWQASGRTYETAPKSFEIDVAIDSDAPVDDQRALVACARKGCFIEQTLGVKNTIQHRIKTPDGWEDC